MNQKACCGVPELQARPVPGPGCLECAGQGGVQCPGPGYAPHRKPEPHPVAQSDLSVLALVMLCTKLLWHMCSL